MSIENNDIQIKLYILDKKLKSLQKNNKQKSII